MQLRLATAVAGLIALAAAPGSAAPHLEAEEVFGNEAVCAHEVLPRTSAPAPASPGRSRPRPRRDPDLRYVTWSGLAVDPLSEVVEFDVRHPDVGLIVRAEAVGDTEAWLSVELIGPDGAVLSAHDLDDAPVAAEIRPGRGTAQVPSTDRPESRLRRGTYGVRVRALPPPGHTGGDVSAVVDVIATFRSEVAVRLDHRIDLNFVYLPGSTLSAEIATTNPHFDRLLQLVDDVLAPAGLRVGEITHLDLDRPEFSVVATWEEAGEMFLTSADFPDRRALNVYCLEGFEAPLNPVVGLSGGIPGPAFNGTRDSGIAMRMEPFLRCPDCLEAYGSLFAHEIGHYIGLYHTTEADRERWDPISDTPECDEPSLNTCPDYDYVMFPVIHSRNRIWSDVQVGVGLTHPLVKTVPVVSGPRTPGRSGRAAELGASPNPFRESVRIQWAAPAALAAEVTVHDVTGRRVRTLSGASGLTWDGRDERGVAVGPGQYFVRVRDESGVRTGRVVRRP